jgi:hypothetical protein
VFHTFPDGTLFNPQSVAALPPLRYDWSEKRWILTLILSGGHTLKARSLEESSDANVRDAALETLHVEYAGMLQALP